MQYRIVPKNGDKLSALGFGCMRLPQRGLIVDQERAVQQIRFAVDQGVNYLDTAPTYHAGGSETLLGKALADGYRDKVKVATKLSHFMLRKPDDMGEMLDTSLQKLNTDHIDYYLLHDLAAESWEKLQEFNVLDFLDRAEAEGKILNKGFSFHGSFTTLKEIIDANDWTNCQIMYNFIDEDHQAGTEGLKYAASKNLAVVIMEPLRGGTLANKLPKGAAQIYSNASSQRSAAEWGLRWVWNHPEATVVLSGMNDEQHITENLHTAETALPNSMNSGELATVSRVADAYKQLIKVPCTGCGYCMPCPQGVNIPHNFWIYNQYCLPGSKIYTRGFYAFTVMGLMGEQASDASLCIGCGKCAKRCPQQIAIPTELKSVKKALGGWQTKLILPLVKRFFIPKPM
ncbi:MAG: aldo/keto reductase [Halobacteriota archaeon]